MITVTTLKTISGYRLSESGLYLRAPWGESPEYPLALEQAPTLTVVRAGSSQVNLSWSPSSGGSPICWRQVKISLEGDIGVNHFLVSWGDGSTTRCDAYGLPRIEIRPSHAYLIDPTGNFVVQAMDASGTEVDRYDESTTWTRSSNWYVQLYRVEKFRGDVNYALPMGRWLLDWTPFTGAAGELSFGDYNASDKWNWGYRLWLREVDDQERPGLVMAPPPWSQTGTGEGAGREAP